MSKTAFKIVSVLLLSTVVSSAGIAADLPRIGYAYPAGGQQGTSFEIKIGGDNIYGASSADITGGGIEIAVTDSSEPEKDKEKNKGKQRKKNQTVIDEVVKLKVSIAKDAEPGNRELRLITPAGISNKLVFQIGQIPETNEAEPNDKKDKAVQLQQLPALVNGQIMPGDVDNFRFPAKKGQHLVFEVSARELIPFIADAVPGWFQATLTLYDAQGKELAYADDYKFNPDTVLFYDVPADGNYTLEIRDSIYRGREDFVYRVKMGELPFITHIFPMGAKYGTSQVKVDVFGKNLPCSSISYDVSKDASSVQYVSVTAGGIVSNSIPFAISSMPEIAEHGTSSEKPLKIRPPVIINGRIKSPSDQGFFSFDGKKDQMISIEVLARRLGSPMDSGILLVNSRGDIIAENDDVKDKAEGIITHQADSAILQKLPENGEYTLIISDMQCKGGEDYAYRLRISPPCPDFELRAVPANITMSSGGSAQMTVHAIRRDDFKGSIKLSLNEGMSGLSLDGGLIPEGVDKIRMTLTSSGEPASGLLLPKISGTAEIGGKPVIHPLVAAEDLMQAFIYQHLVTSVEQAVMISDRTAPFTLSVEMPKEGFVELPLGKETDIKVSATRRPGFNEAIQLQFVDPPKGISFRKANIPAGKDNATVTVRAEAKTEGNRMDNLIVNGIMVVEREENASEGGPGPDKSRENTAGKESKDNIKDDKNVKVDVKDAETRPAPSNKKNRKDRIVVTAPAVPFRLVEVPGKKPDGKKQEEKKKDDDIKTEKKN